MTTDRITHKLFGDLIWDPERTWWFARVRLPDQTECDLHIADDECEARAVIDRAVAYWNGFCAKYQEIGQYIEKELLEDAVRHWRVPKRRAKASLRNVKVEQVSIIDGYCTTIYCSDNDVFLGHVILVNVDKDGNKMSVSVAG